jgi:hypothetical protein
MSKNKQTENDEANEIIKFKVAQSANNMSASKRKDLVNKHRVELKKSIQVGGSFEDLVLKSSIFVDKSLFIDEIIKDPSEAILIAMPRRWGKSLNLDMLRRFLSVVVDEKGQVVPNNQTDNYKLFAGGTIKVQDGFVAKEKEIKTSELIIKNPYSLSIQGKYPVIFIDFKDCKGSKFDEVEARLRGKIDKTVKQFSYLSSGAQLYEGVTVGESYQSLLKTIISGDFSSAIKELSSLLHVYHKEKVWILIDEYDAAANNAYLNCSDEEAKLVSGLFRSVYEPALKGNEHLEKGVMTGVQYIVQSGMLSGLNNLSKYNITSPKYSKYYGINQEEINLLLEHFNIDPRKADQIKDWYNGYQENIGTIEDEIFIDKYNIWSVANYLNNKNEGFRSYWGESGSISFIQPLFKHKDFRKKIEALINNTSIPMIDLTTDFSHENFIQLKAITTNPNIIEIQNDGWDLIFAYLFITGYLTTVLSDGVLEYRLPNKEIKMGFESKIKTYYKQIFNIDNNKFADLTKVLSRVFDKEKVENIKKEFEENFGSQLFKLIQSVTLCDKTNQTKVGLFANEDLMHSLLNYIGLQVVNSKFASERYTKKPDGSVGRADIVISKNNVGLVIEMKYNDNVKKAFEQAKKYEHLVKNDDCKIFLGCNISQDQQVQIFGEIYDQSELINIIEYNSNI